MRYIPYSYLSIAKRCPNGYHKNPETGQCEPKNQKGTSNTSSGCQEGFHQHAGYKNCHEIWKPHKAHTLSCNQHRLLGIPCRYKGEVLDENGSPIIAGVPTRKFNGMSKKERLELDEKNRAIEEEHRKKKEENKESKDDGLVEVKSLSDVSTNVSHLIRKSFDGFKDIEKKQEHLHELVDFNEKVKTDELSDEEVYKGFKEIFEKLDIKTAEFKFPSEYIRPIFNNVVKTLNEHSEILTVLKGLTFENSRGTMHYDSANLTINFNPRYYDKSHPLSEKLGKEEVYQQIKDEVIKQVTDWGFHHLGASKVTSFTHEGGHAVNTFLDILATACNNLTDDLPTFHQKSKDKIVSEIQTAMGELDFVKQGCKVYYDGKYGVNLFFYMKSEAGSKYSKNSPEAKEIKKKLAELGYTVVKEPGSVQARNYGSYMIPIDMWCHVPNENHIAPPTKAFAEYVKSFDSIEDFIEKHKFKRDGKFKVDDDKGNFVRDKFAIDIIDECEEIYKKLYDVEKIIPSDVYSGYGYLGNFEDDIDKGWAKKKTAKDRSKSERYAVAEDVYKGEHLVDTKISACRERIAEAFSDINVRSEKANSMSSLIVQCLKFNVYRYMTGNTTTFTEYVMGQTEGKDLEPPIKKRKYNNVFRNTV